MVSTATINAAGVYQAASALLLAASRVVAARAKAQETKIGWANAITLSILILTIVVGGAGLSVRAEAATRGEYVPRPSKAAKILMCPSRVGSPSAILCLRSSSRR